MFCDAAGRPQYPGKVYRERVWDIVDDSALPSWLSTIGTSPVTTYETVAAGRGRARFQTKVSTPADGDIAGVQTAFNIATANFEEIGFCAYSVDTDGASGTDHVLGMAMNASSTTGFFVQNAPTIDSGDFQYRIYPAASVQTDYPWAKDGNPLRQRDLCVIIRPRLKEFFVFLGNPYEGGATEIVYDKGGWADVSGQSFKFQIATREAAQHYMEFSKLKLWFVSL